MPPLERRSASMNSPPSGSKLSGTATRSLKSKMVAAWSHEWSTLLPSPTHALVSWSRSRPARPMPRRSTKWTGALDIRWILLGDDGQTRARSDVELRQGQRELARRGFGRRGRTGNQIEHHRDFVAGVALGTADAIGPYLAR